MRIAVAGDGTLAAVHEATRVSVLELPGCATFAEIGIDPDAAACDVAWVGTPPRLLVLSRYAAHSTAHLLDPFGPRSIAEIRLESPMKLYGTIGSHALAVGSQGAAVLTATDTHVTPYQFPARVVPVVAGAAGSQFVVALPGSIEEWDPVARMPKRRLKLPRPASITALGGSDRVVWMTTQQEPSRIDVIPLVNRGQPRAHDLPEPIASVSSHPRSDLLACVGAESGRLYVVDLDGRAGLRIVGPEGIERVEAVGIVVGRQPGVVAAQTGRQVVFVALDHAPRDPVRAAESLVVPEKTSSLVEDPSAKVAAARVAAARVTAATPATDTRAGAPQRRPADRRPTWRDEAVAWYRAVAAGASERDAPISSAVDQLIVRLELPLELQPAMVLLYAAHLAGEGAAPVALSRALGRDWTEALGRGQLAARGITVHEGSRVRLARTIQRALDELPPESGTLVGEPGTVALLGPCAVVAPLDAPLVPLAERCLSAVGGAILVGGASDLIVLEAQVRGAVPMVRTERVIDQPMIIVADSEQAAEQLGLPRID